MTKWAVLVLAPLAGVAAQDLCLGQCEGEGANRTCFFNMTLDIFAGETGYYRVEGCEGVQPTLGMEQGVKYTFLQLDPTNWYHPLGFAYGPDGVYRGNDELEPEVRPPNGAECDGECQHPVYKRNGEVITLDEYEPTFAGDRDAWLEDEWTVDVTITDSSTTEFFYFCHIHNDMSARIKVLENGEIKGPDVVEIPYEYHTISEFDALCGTHNVSQFENVAAMCPDMTFTCDEPKSQFTKCMDAINCAMHVEMRTSGSSDPAVTFMHQMIAHHRNAVNMAKILLKANPPSLRCGTSYDGRRLLGADMARMLQDAAEEEDDHEVDGIKCHDGNEGGGTPIVTLLWDVVNTQNAQVTLMRAWLADNQQPSFDYCEHNSFPTAVVGVAVGGLVLAAVAAAATFLCMRERRASSSVEAPPKSPQSNVNIA